MASDTDRFDLDTYLVRFNRPARGWEPASYVLLHQLDKQQALDLMSALESFLEPAPLTPKFLPGDPVLVQYGNYTTPIIGEVMTVELSEHTGTPLYSVNTAYSPGSRRVYRFLFEEQLTKLVPLA